MTTAMLAGTKGNFSPTHLGGISLSRADLEFHLRIICTVQPVELLQSTYPTEIHKTGGTVHIKALNIQRLCSPQLFIHSLGKIYFRKLLSSLFKRRFLGFTAGKGKCISSQYTND